MFCVFSGEDSDSGLVIFSHRQDDLINGDWEILVDGTRDLFDKVFESGDGDAYLSNCSKKYFMFKVKA